MDTIKIKKEKYRYTAIFADGLPMIQAIAEFGTNELPTTFTEKACYSEVIKELKRLNPDCRVIIA